MKEKIIALIFMTVIAALAAAQSQPLVPKKCYLHLTGTIDNVGFMEMNLVKITDSLYGDLIFLKGEKNPTGFEDIGRGIPFSGRMTSADGFLISAMAPSSDIVLKGKFNGTQKLTGTFESRKAGKIPLDLEEKYPDGSVGMDVYYLKGSMPLVKRPKSPTASVQYSMLLPSESANPLTSDSLNHLILTKFSGKQVRISQPGKVLDAMRQVYFDNYVNANEAIYKESMGASFNWQYLKFLHVLINGDHILSFYIDHYAFTGGAHGLQTKDFTSVNLWTGREIVLKDLFRENSIGQLSALLGSKVHEMKHIPAAQSLKDAGYFTDTIHPTENFYITYYGIGFYYNQYDIAPYAAGPVNVFIPFAELKDMLNPGGVLRELMR